jgi:hypothetical protein
MPEVSNTYVQNNFSNKSFIACDCTVKNLSKRRTYLYCQPKSTGETGEYWKIDSKNTYYPLLDDRLVITSEYYLKG